MKIYCGGIVFIYSQVVGYGSSSTENYICDLE